MKNKNILSLLAFLLVSSVFGQGSNLEFTFSAIYNTSHIQLDSVKIMNRSQGGENMIYWPDTNISMEVMAGDTMLFVGYAVVSPSIGIDVFSENSEGFRLSQNYPNPVREKSTISMYLPDNGRVSMLLTDVQGRILLAKDYQLEQGEHIFSFMPGSGKLFFLTASWKGMTESIKILSSGENTGQRCSLEHIEKYETVKLTKLTTQSKASFVRESGILDNPEENGNYTFQFTKGVPCPGTPTVTYGGQVYNTVQIFSQCWMKENLNIGDMINGNVEMSDDGFIEKYCYNNEPDSCISLGGLHLWDEMMQYITGQGIQGICPPGWHLPTDDEWKVLEGVTDTHYGVGDPEWDISQYYRGFDAGDRLKATSGWKNAGNGSDAVGFSSLPGGIRWHDGLNYFHTGGEFGNWWSSSTYSNFTSWIRSLGHDSQESHRAPSGKDLGYSVRCLKDN
jgi:uncharacterized protein (TIGR02145 family)